MAESVEHGGREIQMKETCSQCGKKVLGRACGPTHAMLAAEARERQKRITAAERFAKSIEQDDDKLLSTKGVTMEFRKHYETIKELGQEPEETMPADAKVRINELLFAILPPKTAINDLDDLSLAIWATVRDAWDGKI